MSTKAQIQQYIDSQPEPKRADMQTLHLLILETMPGCKLWYLDGKDETGKIVSNPNIGYGQACRKYADGTTKDFYQVGLSANKSGISVYILGLDDKTLLARHFGQTIGKATVTGYCIKFKTLKDIDPAVLQEAVRLGAGNSQKP